MRKFSLLLLLVMVLVFQVNAQEALNTFDEAFVTQIDAFGLEQLLLVGKLRNDSTDAYANINVYADILDADGAVIGEAFGYMVDECGEAILDFPLQPNQERAFLATVELYEEGQADSFEITLEGEITEAETEAAAEINAAITRVSSSEVVSVEWEDANNLRYGVGCDGSIFTTYDWYHYQVDTAETTVLEANPNAQYITDAFLQQTGINQLTQGGAEDPSLLERSFLTFPTQTPRIVYQNDIHTIFTAETDGSFKRIVHSILSRFSLQGFVWSPVGNFAAYYFGAYGEFVQYFTASPVNGRISAALQDNTPSATVPGLSDDGQRVIISGTFPDDAGEEITGYWFSSAINQQRELLFEVDELAGNNYPAPVYYRKDDDNRFIYLIRPIAGVPTLQCYYREGEELTTLAALPLQLETNDRAWAWLSPDSRTLAIGANGNHGGLWLVDLSAFPACQ